MDIIQQLNSLEEECRRRSIPLIGSEKGRWLSSFVQRHQPKYILEIGTAIGYSGIILGSVGGHVTAIDKNEKEMKEAEQNFLQFQIKHTCIISEGVHSLAILAKTKPSSFDLIFIDFAKKEYFTILDNCLTLIKDGGYIIADNITKEDCRNFKEVILHHQSLQTEIINIGDGMSCSKVIKREQNDA